MLIDPNLDRHGPLDISPERFFELSCLPFVQCSIRALI